eukprot:6809942-Prymnesium_polylepis.1
MHSAHLGRAGDELAKTARVEAASTHLPLTPSMKPATNSTRRGRSGSCSHCGGLRTRAHGSELSSRPQTYSERLRVRISNVHMLQEGSRM